MLDKYNEKVEEEGKKYDAESRAKYFKHWMKYEEYDGQIAKYSDRQLKKKFRSISRTLAVQDRILTGAKNRIKDDGFESIKTTAACVLGCIFGAACIAVGAMALKQDPASMSLVESGASLLNTTTETFSKGFGGAIVGLGVLDVGLSVFNSKTCSKATHKLLDEKVQKNKVKRDFICEEMDKRGISYDLDHPYTR